MTFQHVKFYRDVLFRNFEFYVAQEELMLSQKIVKQYGKSKNFKLRAGNL